MARRYYSSTAVATTTTGSLSNSATSITVAALTGYPGTTPWTAVLEPDTVNEEVVEVTNVSGTTLTVTRGVDGTSAVAHDSGVKFQHGVSARDFDEANAFVNGGGIPSTALTSTAPANLASTASAGSSSDVARRDHVHAFPSASDVGAVANSLVDAKGDLITATADNTPARLAVGATNGHVLKVNSATATGLEWGAVDGLPSQTGNTNRLLTTNGTAASWTNTITNLIQLAPEERFNVVASAATGTININFLTAAVWFYTTNASANHTINFRGDASNTLNSLLATGDAITVGWIINNGTTAYYPTTIQIDGSSVTPKWLNNSAPPTSSQANQTAGIDAFTFTIVKTAATPTYTVLGSWAQYR